jgi:hypothetical protein
MTSDMDDLTQHNPPNKNFAIIFNEVLRDPRLTAAEAGILCRLLSHVEGWRFNADRLAAEWPGLSKRGAVAAMRGLRNHGYIHRVVTHAGTRRIRTELHLFSTSTPVCGLHGCQDCATRAEAETQLCDRTELRGQSDQAKQGVSAGGSDRAVPCGHTTARTSTRRPSFQEDHKEDDLSLSGLGRRIAARLRTAGAADVGEREIQAIEGEIKSRAKGPVTAYLRAIPDDDLLTMLDEHRASVAEHQRQQQAAAEAATEAAARAAEIAALPVCDHGTPAGMTPLHAGLLPRCPLCRKGLADDGEAFTPASRDVIEEARRKLAGMRGTVRTALGSRSA